MVFKKYYNWSEVPLNLRATRGWGVYGGGQVVLYQDYIIQTENSQQQQNKHALDYVPYILIFLCIHIPHIVYIIVYI